MKHHCIFIFYRKTLLVPLVVPDRPETTSTQMTVTTACQVPCQHWLWPRRPQAGQGQQAAAAPLQQCSPPRPSPCRALFVCGPGLLVPCPPSTVMTRVRRVWPSLRTRSTGRLAWGPYWLSSRSRDRGCTMQVRDGTPGSVEQQVVVPQGAGSCCQTTQTSSRYVPLGQVLGHRRCCT
jgi:hypothetical protein